MVISESTKEGKGRNTSHAYAAIRGSVAFTDSRALPSISRGPMDSRPGCRNEVCGKGIGETTVPCCSGACRTKIVCSVRDPGETHGLLNQMGTRIVELSGNRLTRETTALIYQCQQQRSSPGVLIASLGAQLRYCARVAAAAVMSKRSCFVRQREKRTNKLNCVFSQPYRPRGDITGRGPSTSRDLACGRGRLVNTQRRHPAQRAAG